MIKKQPLGPFKVGKYYTWSKRGQRHLIFGKRRVFLVLDCKFSHYTGKMNSPTYDVYWVYKHRKKSDARYSYLFRAFYKEIKS